MPPRDNEQEAIRNLQRYLRQLSFDDNRITPRPPLDGIFDSNTENALRQFQGIKGLPQTGTADQETWELLFASYRASLANNSPPRTVALFSRTPNSFELHTGSTGFVISALQYMLTELTLNYQDLGDFEINGIYDENTRNAVSAFQAHNALRQTGNVDRLTWNQIVDQYNILFTRYPIE